MKASLRARVLITDAGERSMLATCRGLHAAGYKVSAAGFDPLAVSRWSRYCSEFVRVRDPRSDATGFISDLRAYLKRRPCDVLIPGSDFSLLAISQARELLEGLTRLGLPPHAVVESSLDRELLGRAAASAGLTAAESARCSNFDEARAVAATVGFPLLLKSISVARHTGTKVIRGQSTRRVENREELATSVGAHGDSCLIQRAVTGSTLSFGGVMAAGQMLGCSLALYERTWPPSAGNASFATTRQIPTELIAVMRRLLLEVEWEGIFEVELIEVGPGVRVAIDFNPRPYGSMALAIAAGANLPALWCDWLCGRSPNPAQARPGRRYRWEDADLLHVLWQLRHGNFPAAVRALRPWPKVVHPHFQRSDPLPLLGRILWLMRKVLRIGGGST